MGTVRYLANIAGIQHIDSVDGFPMDIYDKMQRLMVRAPFYLSQLVIQLIKKTSDRWGVIANMASIHAHICTKNKPVYNMAKFGLPGLEPVHFRRGRGPRPLVYHQHRVCENPPGPQADPGNGSAARHHPGGRW